MGLEVQSGEEKIDLAKDGDLRRHEKKEEHTYIVKIYNANLYSYII